MMNNLKLMFNRITSLNWMLCWTCKKILNILNNRNELYLMEAMAEALILYKQHVKPEMTDTLDFIDLIVSEFE